MKFLERTTLSLFSVLMIIISVIICLLVFGWLDTSLIGSFTDVILQNTAYSNTALGLAVIFILLSVYCIFFSVDTKDSNEYKNGILLENSDGKLLITKDTIENLVSNVAKSFEGAEGVTTKIELDRENNVRVFVNLTVKENAIIKELSSNVQTKIKETIKRTSDLDVKEVNIKIKNIEAVKNTVQE